MKFSLLVLSLNEIHGFTKIFPELKKKFDGEIIVVDGNSRDGTIEYLKKNKVNFIIQKNTGLGSAYLEGIKKCSGDIIITFSPDGN